MLSSALCEQICAISHAVPAGEAPSRTEAVPEQESHNSLVHERHAALFSSRTTSARELKAQFNQAGCQGRDVPIDLTT